MIDQERVRDMTKLAAYEMHEGKKYQKAMRYFRSDFVARHLMKGFVAATVAFGLMLAVWVVCNLEELVAGLDTMDLVGFGTTILVRYLVFLIVYLVIVDIYANLFYARGKRNTKRFYRRLKHLGRLYEEQEYRTMSAQEDEEIARREA